MNKGTNDPDVDPNKGGSKKESVNAGGTIDDASVASYLHDNSDFLIRHPELVQSLLPPGRWSGDSVIDMQQFMLERLRGEIDNLRSSSMDLIDVSRGNLSVQNRTYNAVHALLAANDFAQLAGIIGNDLPLLLDLDVVIIGFEPPKTPIFDLVSPDVRQLSLGLPDQFLGNGDVVLLSEASDDGTIFGDKAGLVRSAALVRLRPTGHLPGGILALGSHGSGDFHAGLATDSIVFLARVAECCTERLLSDQE
ncbi:MAG: DUF484 family protein [Rhodospirillales bacterium]